MEKVVISLFPADKALPAVNSRCYIAYLVGKDNPCILEYEDGVWYKDSVQVDKKDVDVWGICTRVGEK